MDAAAPAALPDLDRTALLVVDVQRGFDDTGYWGPRDNPGCEDNIAALLSEWQQRSRPVVFVRHDSTEPASPLRPGHPGNAFKPIITGTPDLLVSKSVNSCFHGSCSPWTPPTPSTAPAPTAPASPPPTSPGSPPPVCTASSPPSSAPTRC